jgi:hypothetical protein
MTLTAREAHQIAAAYDAGFSESGDGPGNYSASGYWWRDVVDVLYRGVPYYDDLVEAARESEQLVALQLGLPRDTPSAELREAFEEANEDE